MSTNQRSRSRPNSPLPGHYTTAAGRTHLIQPPPGLMMPPSSAATPSITLADLLQAQQQQNLLLQQQLALLQEKHISTQHYSDPFEVLNVVDPDLRPLLLEWMKDYQSTLQHSVTQSDLQQKYLDIEKAGELQRSFADESNKEWQWPQSFKAQAKEMQITSRCFVKAMLTNLPCSKTVQSHSIFAEHTGQCDNGMRESAKISLRHIRDSAQVSSLNSPVKMSNSRSFQISSRRGLSAMTAFSLHRPKLPWKPTPRLSPSSRSEKSFRKQELSRSRIAYRKRSRKKPFYKRSRSFDSRMSANFWLWLCLSSRAHRPRVRQLRKKKVSSTSALAYLVKQYPDIAEKHNLLMQKPDSRPDAKSRPSKARHTSSSWRWSSKSSRKSESSASRGRSISARASSRSSRTSSKTSSKGSRKSSKGTPSNAPKGRGKGRRGQGRGARHGQPGSREGRGKQVRFRNQTPRPSRS